MPSVHPSRRRLVVVALLLAAMSVWVVVDGRPEPVVALYLVATVVTAVGVLSGITAVAPWYNSVGTGVVGLLGVGVLLLGYADPFVTGLTSGFASSAAVVGFRYTRARRPDTPPEESA